jgi:hypothetical protein
MDSKEDDAGDFITHIGAEPIQKRKYKRNRNYAKASLEEIQKYFDVPQAEAAAKLQISGTKLKNLAQSYGIKRWPYQQVRILNTTLT